MKMLQSLNIFLNLDVRSTVGWQALALIEFLRQGLLSWVILEED